MGVQISGNDITATGTVTVGTLVVSSGINFTGLAWLPKTAAAVSVNAVAFAYPLSVVLATFTAPEITALDVSGKSLTSLTGVGVLTALTDLDCSTNSLTALNIAGATALDTLDASVNALSIAEVDTILVTLDDNGLSGGTVNVSGGTNGIPSATGLAAKTSLEGKGWTVTVNS